MAVRNALLAPALLAATLAWAPAAHAGEANLSEGEIGYVRQLGELAGGARFCYMEWRPLYKAFIRTWRESGRPEADILAVNDLFLEAMREEEERLPPDFCPGSGQVRLDYMMEEAMRQFAE